MRKLWAALNVNLRGRLVDFGDIRRLFSKICTETFKKMYTIQNNADHVPQKKSKAVFLSIRYRKTSQTQDVKSQSTKRGVGKLAQLKRDSAFEQKTRIVPNQEIWGSFQNSFLVTTEAKSPPDLKKTFLERTQRRFGKFLFCSRNRMFFTSIRYHKTSQTQDGKSQSTNRSLRKPAQAKPNMAVKQK